MELLDYGRDGAELDYAQKIQRFHRFLIDHLNAEASSPLQNPSPITKILGITGQNVMTCSNCKTTREKPYSSHVIDLIYPKKVRVLLILPCVFSMNMSFLDRTEPQTPQLCPDIARLVVSPYNSQNNML